MALAFDSIVYDGRRSKAFLVSLLANDAAADLVVDFSTNGMTDFEGAVAPIFWSYAITAATTDEALLFRVHTITAAACTVRHMVPGVGATAVSVQIQLWLPRGIAG